jgi:hypothetical protein
MRCLNGVLDFLLIFFFFFIIEFCHVKEEKNLQLSILTAILLTTSKFLSSFVFLARQLSELHKKSRRSYEISCHTMGHPIFRITWFVVQMGVCKKINFFYLKLLLFLNNFDVLMLKINFKK